MPATDAPYPKFIPPAELGGRSAKEWNKKETDRYVAWFHANRGQRVEALLKYLGVNRGGTPEELLTRVAGAALPLFRMPQFSERRKDLTNEGYALAADIGLLIAELMERDAGSKVKWGVLRRPKSAADFQQPVLEGFSSAPMNPIRLSLNQAWGALPGESGPGAWADLYRIWRAML